MSSSIDTTKKRERCWETPTFIQDVHAKKKTEGNVRHTRPILYF